MSKVLHSRVRLLTLPVVCQRRVVQPTGVFPKTRISGAESYPTICSAVRFREFGVADSSASLVHHLCPEQAGLGGVWRQDIFQRPPGAALIFDTQTAQSAFVGLRTFLFLEEEPKKLSEARRIIFSPTPLINIRLLVFINVTCIRVNPTVSNILHV